MPDFLLPDLGEGLTGADIVSWLVDVGDTVTVDQPVVEVETAKAVVEVPVPFSGTVTARFGRPGETLSVGAPLLSVAGGADQLDKASAEVPVPAPSADSSVAGFREPGVVVAEHAKESSGNVLVGYGTSGAAHRRHRTARRLASRAPLPTAEPTVRSNTELAIPQQGQVKVISPPVRMLARENGVDLSGVTGSGPDGIIRRADVEAEIDRRARLSPVPDAADTVVPFPAAGSTVAGEMRRVPLTGIRKAIADKMSRSRRDVPEATTWVDVDVTDLVAARRDINAADSSRPVSLLGLLSRFAVAALTRFPELNGRIENDEILVPDFVHLGFAAQTDRGLVVPVIRDAHRLSARKLSIALTDKTDAARTGSLTPADLTGGTFTVNNYGVFGVDGSAAIINVPEVAILGMGRILDRPWVVNGQVVPRKITQLSLAFDHRVCDGGTAGGFLRQVADAMESPLRALADL